MEPKTLILFVLAALGIVAPLPEFIGGMIFCILSSYAMFYFKPPADNRSLWGTLVLAVFAGLLATNIHRALFPEWDLRLVMAASGAMARFVVMAVFAFGNSAVERVGKIPQGVRFPWEK